MTATVDLRQLVTFSSGGTPSKSVTEYYSGDIPWITGADIDEDGTISPRASITPTAIAKSAANEIPAGTVLLVTRTSVGKTAIAPFSLAFSQDITALRPNPDALDPQYLRHFLRSSATLLVDRARGATIKGVTREDVASLKVPISSLDEQKRIAEILDQDDALLAKRRRAFPLLDELAQSIFLDMFGDINDDEMAFLGDHLTFVTSGGRGWAKYYSDSGSRFIRSLDVRMNEIEDRSAVYVTPPNNAEARRTRVHSGDVLLTITGSLIGRVAPVSPNLDGSYVSQHVAILRPEASRIDPGFLAFFLSMPRGLLKTQFEEI